jgi:hypothetical protein
MQFVRDCCVSLKIVYNMQGKHAFHTCDLQVTSTFNLVMDWKRFTVTFCVLSASESPFEIYFIILLKISTIILPREI